jgi:hypothetical protein
MIEILWGHDEYVGDPNSFWLGTLAGITQSKKGAKKRHTKQHISALLVSGERALSTGTGARRKGPGP